MSLVIYAIDQTSSMCYLKKKLLLELNKVLRINKNNSDHVNIFFFSDEENYIDYYNIFEISENDYIPKGKNSFFYSLSRIITKSNKYIEDKNINNVIFIIISNSADNNSTKVTKDVIKEQISILSDWTINLYGSNQNIQKIGYEININNVQYYMPTNEGIEKIFMNINKLVTHKK